MNDCSWESCRSKLQNCLGSFVCYIMIYIFRRPRFLITILSSNQLFLGLNIHKGWISIERLVTISSFARFSSIIPFIAFEVFYTCTLYIELPHFPTKYGIYCFHRCVAIFLDTGDEGRMFEIRKWNALYNFFLLFTEASMCHVVRFYDLVFTRYYLVATKYDLIVTRCDLVVAKCTYRSYEKRSRSYETSLYVYIQCTSTCNICRFVIMNGICYKLFPNILVIICIGKSRHSDE